MTFKGVAITSKPLQESVKIVHQSKKAKKSASAHKPINKSSTNYIFDYYEGRYLF